MKKTNTKQRGITLIALIITIIVMLILVGVSVNIALNNGLFKATQNAARETEAEKEKEKDISEGQITVDNTKYSSLEEYVNGSTYKYNITVGGVDTGIGFNDNDTFKTISNRNNRVTIEGNGDTFHLEIDGTTIYAYDSSTPYSNGHEPEDYMYSAMYVDYYGSGEDSLNVLKFLNHTYRNSISYYFGEDSTKELSYRINN